MLVKMSTQLNIPIINASNLVTTNLVNNLNSKLGSDIDTNLKILLNKKVIFSRGRNEMRPINGWNNKTAELEIGSFKTCSKKITIAGIDSSAIHIAETPDGSIYSARVSVVFSQSNKLYNYFRIGPIIYYIDEENASKISVETCGSTRLKNILLFDRYLAQRLIREKLERTVTYELAKTLSDSIILIDGCLKSSKLEETNRRLQSILNIAKNNNNVIIGISKSTKLGLLNQLSQILYTSKVIPSFIIIDKLVSNVFSDILGHLLLVRFSEDGHPHRVDMSSPDFEDNLSGIISNDIFYHGYPETLKVAHHLSVFTSSQSNSIKSYLVQKAGVLEIPSEDLRHVTLGSMSCIH